MYEKIKKINGLHLEFLKLFYFSISFSYSPIMEIQLGPFFLEVCRKYAWGKMTLKDFSYEKGSYFIDFFVPHWNRGGFYLSFRKREKKVFNDWFFIEVLFKEETENSF